MWKGWIVGLAGVSSALAAPALALAQSGAGSQKKAGKAPAAEKQKPAAQPPAETPPEISEEGRKMAEVVKMRYGDHLSDEQLEEIAKELTWRMRAGETLRKLELANGDEPDFIFKA